MELIFRGSFFRDWDSHGNKELSKAIKVKTDEIKAARSQAGISRLKKLRKRVHRYKIEIPLRSKKVYWIYCIILGNKIELVRLKPESFFKKRMK